MRSAAAEVAGVRISHPDRVVYPQLGITKLDVAKYYEAIGKWIVPHVADRPLTLVHCPNGLAGQCNFMKHSKLWGPSAIRRVPIQEKTKIGDYMVADSVEAVVALAQMGILEIHTWNSTTKNIERPNRIVIDLDPGDRVGWKQVADAARLVRKALAALGLDSFLKTTGGRGLHVVVPLTPRANWSECLEFSRLFCQTIEQSDPKTFTTNFAKAGRGSKILLDYLRNNRTNTSIAAYSTRARANATVSVPVTWSELKPKLDSERFTIQTVFQRLVKLRVDPWNDYWTTKQKITAAMIKALRLH
ncbi:MAG: non-homologous end-joining DNA ligase [Gemmatimonadaceae bacterium]